MMVIFTIIHNYYLLLFLLYHNSEYYPNCGNRIYIVLINHNCSYLQFLTHRIHGAGIYANIGVYWWDPWSTIYNVTIPTDELHHFQRGRLTTNQNFINLYPFNQVKFTSTASTASTDRSSSRKEMLDKVTHQVATATELITPEAMFPLYPCYYPNDIRISLNQILLKMGKNIGYHWDFIGYQVNSIPIPLKSTLNPWFCCPWNPYFCCLIPTLQPLWLSSSPGWRVCGRLYLCLAAFFVAKSYVFGRFQRWGKAMGNRCRKVMLYTYTILV